MFVKLKFVKLVGVRIEPGENRLIVDITTNCFAAAVVVVVQWYVFFHLSVKTERHEKKVKK